MQVKIEPNEESFELPVGLDILTDIESDLFREQLFGNSTVISNSDISESSSDDDHLSKIAFNYEPFPEYAPDSSTLPATAFWDPSSSRSSSTSSSFDQTLAEYEFNQSSLNEFRDDDIDVEVGTCSPQDIIMNVEAVKKEIKTESLMESLGSHSPNPIWDLLCSGDIKPNVKQILETPPVTPPEGNAVVLGDSPPTSPIQVHATTTSESIGTSPCLLPPPTSVITLSPISPKSELDAPPKKKVALAPKIPFKIVTTITANESNSSNNRRTVSKNNTSNNIIHNKIPTSRAIKIQPKSSSVPSNKTVLRIGDSTVPKLSITKTAASSSTSKATLAPTKSVYKLSTKNLVQKPIVISSPQTTSHSTTINKSVPVPSVVQISNSGISTEQSTSSSRLPPLAPALNPSLKNNSLAELRALKRQQRMIKNRESASLSRKRKKEYLQSLEERVKELDIENAKLRMENERLIRRVTALENEKVIMRAARFPIKRSSTAVMGVMFLLLFNFSPILNMFKGGNADRFKGDVRSGASILESQKFSGSPEKTFHHRSLLSYSPFESDLGTQDSNIPSSANLSYICPVNFNSTESLRIDNELRDLFDSSSKDWTLKSGKPAVRSGRKNSFDPKSKVAPKKSLLRKDSDEGEQKKALAAPLTSAVSSAAYQYLYKSEEESPPSLLMGKREQEKSYSKGLLSTGGSLQSLFDSIERRNDTYYVVSFTADHLLLPASAHNTSVRPKMSLLVPTPKAWGDNDQIGLMQIDCEVTHTRIVRWAKHQEEMSVSSVDSSYSNSPNTNVTESTDSFPKERPKRRKRKKV